MNVVIIRIMLIANCVTTSTFLKEILLPPALNNPFNVFTGWKDDMNKAGYNPERVPIIKGVRSKGIIIFDCSSVLKESSWPEVLFSQGMANQVNRAAIIIATKQISTDSLRNWKMSSFFLAPITLRIPISLALNADLAVERFI